MKTDKATIADIFDKHRRYVVPLFQRGYVWTQQGQWEPLWEDLLDQAAYFVRQRSNPKVRSHKHFLGALVLNLTQTKLQHVQVVEIIDGQQRLTTLQMLLAAVKDEFKELRITHLDEILHRLTSNIGTLAFDEERYKVWTTSGMNVHLRNVLEAGSAQAVEDIYARFHVLKRKKWHPPRPPVVEAYLFFAKAMREYLDDDPEELPYELLDLTRSERAQVLAEALLQHVELVTIELEAEDDAQVIFETLNARGEPLTPSDLVRNFVFLTATRENRDVSRIYHDLWRTYEEDPPEQPFWRQVERQGRLKRSRLDLFLFHYVTFRTGQELKISHVYQIFRDWWDSQPGRDIEFELSELQRYSRFYASMLAPDVTTSVGRSYQRLRILDYATPTRYYSGLRMNSTPRPPNSVRSSMMSNPSSYDEWCAHIPQRDTTDGSLTCLPRTAPLARPRQPRFAGCLLHRPPTARSGQLMTSLHIT